VEHRIVEAGRLEPVSLFARFGFTRPAYHAALQTWLAARQHGPAAKPREIATYIHELTHYLQYTTTPYGLFLQWCRLLQSHSTINIVQTLLEGGCNVVLPLLYNLPDMPPAVAQEVKIYLGTWLNVENLVNHLNGDSERRFALIDFFTKDMERVSQGLYPMRPPLKGLQHSFLDVQELLALFIEHRNRVAQEEGNPDPMYPDGIDRTALAQEAAAGPTQRDRAIERSAAAMDMVAGNDNPFGVAAIIEGAATAAEYWNTGLGYEQFAEWVTTKAAPKLGIYRAALTRGLDAIGTRDLNEFLASFMTICELSLYPPLLPQHAGLRLQRPGFEQLLPPIRFTKFMSSASRVRPMQGRADHSRYVLELCRDQGWVPEGWVPEDWVVRSAIEGPQRVSDPICHIYQTAQRWRAQVQSSAFIGVDRFLFDLSPMGESWRETFDFVINDFSDRTTYHRNKSFLQSMTTRYLNMQGMQAIMLSDNLTLAAPYSNSADQKQWMTEWLRERFAQLFKRDFPDLQVV
jgi:hypothetical protein